MSEIKTIEQFPATRITMSARILDSTIVELNKVLSKKDQMSFQNDYLEEIEERSLNSISMTQIIDSILARKQKVEHDYN